MSTFTLEYLAKHNQLLFDCLQSKFFKEYLTVHSVNNDTDIYDYWFNLWVDLPDDPILHSPVNKSLFYRICDMSEDVPETVGDDLSL